MVTRQLSRHPLGNSNKGGCYEKYCRLYGFVGYLHNISLSQISATFAGDTTKIWDTNFGWSCGGVFFPIIKTSNDTIYITECDTLDLLECDCNYTVCTSLIGLSVGTYTAVISRQWKFHFVAPNIDTILGSITKAGSVTFTLINPPTLSKALSFYQSGCLAVGIVFPDNKTYL